MTNRLSLSLVAAFVFTSLVLDGCAASNDDDDANEQPAAVNVNTNTDTTQPMRGRRESEEVCGQNWANCTNGCNRAYISPFGGRENTPDAYQAANNSCESACNGTFIACSVTAHTTGL